jgi:hypothetical protein
MSIIDVIIPLVPGILLVAFPTMLTSKSDSIEKSAKKKNKLRKIGYILIGVAALYFVLMLAAPH